MSTFQQVIIVGNLGDNPEVRHLPQGGEVCNISVATSEQWTDKNTGQKQERTEWHRIVFFGRLAEIVGQYGHKGGKMLIEGTLRTRKWQDQAGNDRWTTEIVGDKMKLLSSRPQGQQQQHNQYDQSYHQPPAQQQHSPPQAQHQPSHQPAHQQASPPPMDGPMGGHPDDDIPF